MHSIHSDEWRLKNANVMSLWRTHEIKTSVTTFEHFSSNAALLHFFREPWSLVSQTYILCKHQLPRGMQWQLRITASAKVLFTYPSLHLMPNTMPYCLRGSHCGNVPCTEFEGCPGTRWNTKPSLEICWLGNVVEPAARFFARWPREASASAESWGMVFSGCHIDVLRSL